MKVCYVLPQYYKNSAENFYHIINFLEELGRNVELYVVIEHGDQDINISSAKDIFVLLFKKALPIPLSNTKFILPSIFFLSL